MKRVLIHVFSGTGNSFHAAKTLREELIPLGYSVNILRVEKAFRYDNGEYDIHVFLFPVYAFSVPQLMQSYMRGLPKAQNAKAVVLSTNGEVDAKRSFPGHPGQCLNQAMRILHRRGYHVFLTDSIGYPVNLPAFISPPTPDDSFVIIEEAQKKLKIITQKMDKFEESYFPCGVILHIVGWLFGLLYNGFGRLNMGKLYVADKRCTHCALCEKVCPSSSIVMRNGYPRWTWHCQGCQRCINVCPVKSIQTSVFRIGFLVAEFCLIIAVFGTLKAALVSIIPLPIISSLGFFADIVLFILLSSVLLILSDILLSFLEGLPFLRGLLGVSFTKGFRRTLAPDFNPQNPNRAK